MLKVRQKVKEAKTGNSRYVMTFARAIESSFLNFVNRNFN